MDIKNKINHDETISIEKLKINDWHRYCHVINILIFSRV